MAQPLRVGVQLPEVERVVGWAEYAALARAAEEADFDSVWLGDHMLYRDDGAADRGPWDAGRRSPPSRPSPAAFAWDLSSPARPSIHRGCWRAWQPR
jgi:alkanesulfonate monooxygenase SsuD/methylene tetrahydromethanopterin reductase-like flavin-dependent oxidoreductase (luciferase family)